MGQTYSMAEALRRGRGIYDFVWPPDNNDPVWPYVGGWGDQTNDFFNTYPPAGVNVETIPSVSGVSIGPSSTVPSVSLAWYDSAASKMFCHLVTLEHPVDEDVPGGFRLYSSDGNRGEMPNPYSGQDQVWFSTLGRVVRPSNWSCPYNVEYYPYGSLVTAPFGSALLPVGATNPNTGVFIPPRLHLRLHLDGSRPTVMKRHPIRMSLRHVLGAPAVEEICGVFPVAGRSRVTVQCRFAGNGFGVTSSFRVTGVSGGTSQVNQQAVPREILLWPTTPGATISLDAANNVARAVLQHPACDFVMVKAQVSNIAAPFWTDVYAED